MQKIDVGQTVFFFYADDHETKEKWIGAISNSVSIGKSMINPKIINESSSEDNDDDSD